MNIRDAIRFCAGAATAAWLLCGAPGVRGAEATPDGNLSARGRAALDDGLYPLAERLFRQSLDKGDGRGAERDETVILLVRALYHQKKFAEMIEALRLRKQWLQKAEDTAAVVFWRALALHELGQNERALAELAAAEARFADSDYACRMYRLRAACFLVLGRGDEAATTYAAYDAACGSDPGAAGNLLDWGGLLYGQGRLAESAAVLRRLVALKGGGEAGQAGRMRLGNLLARMGQTNEAVAVLRVLADDSAAAGDLRAQAWYATGALLEQSNALAAAAAAITQGVAVAQSVLPKAKGDALLGRLYLRGARWLDGVNLLRTFVSAWPADPDAGGFQLALAGALLDHGQFDEAARQYQHYLESFGDTNGQAQAYAGKGWALLGTNRLAEAAGAFEKAYALHRDPARKEQCLFKVGDAYALNGQHRLARETYERVCAEFPGGALRDRARVQSAVALSAAGDWAAAIAAFQELSGALRGTTLGEEALFRLAAAREAMGAWQEAASAYDNGMRAYTNGTFFARFLHGRGMVKYHLFNFTEALADFDNVLARFPGNAEAEQAFYMRGMCLYGLMRDDDAMAACREFVTRFPDSRWLPDVLQWIGRHEYNRGEYAAAQTSFLAAAGKSAGSALGSDALLWAGHAAVKSKEFLRAVEHYSQLIKEYPHSPRLAEARFSQGDALSELGKFSAAILTFDEVITKYPQSDLVPAAWGRKGDCQFTPGGEDPARYAESMASYRVVVGHQAARPDLIVQANCKIGRCLEKMGRPREAFDQYYLNVILKYLEERANGVWHDLNSKVWFTRAAFNAADILEAERDWRGLVNVLQRVSDADVPAAGEARERSARIKAEHWGLF